MQLRKIKGQFIQNLLILFPDQFYGPGTLRWDLKLRVGVPKNVTFNQFVNVQEIGDTKKYKVTGFSIDVSQAALDLLPFRLEPEFIPFEASSYDYIFGKLNGTEVSKQE